MGELVPENSESKTIPVQAPIKPGLPDIDEEQVRVATKALRRELHAFGSFILLKNILSARFFKK